MKNQNEIMQEHAKSGKFGGNNEPINLTVSEPTKESALANWLGCEEDELTPSKWDHYGLDVFSYGGNDYAVGTDEEADKAVAENIEQLAWAFNANFLANKTNLPQEVFEAMQDKCESANDAVLACIKQTCGLEDFVADAVSADGRGHFLSGYDGEEVEEQGFFIYKN
jgi:hypothetical protein